ncbi:anillin-like isoform X2 [Bolinopsis microptera]|uniref:anillin-like isoform X2 n=1 Tax=Bolinopsis microptera TaxID=2820187 RepID=UPI003079BCD3
MTDTQDSTEMLLRKARERRARNPENLLLQREKTGSEKMCTQSIASGIRSPTPARKTYNTTAGIGMGVSKGVAGGVKGARVTPKREVKAVPLEEIEDDFECLQERMRNRFKQNSPDLKENLLSPKTMTTGTKRTFFDNPSTENKRNPLSPSRQSNVMSPTKKFFPDLKSDDTVEPMAPKRTTSRLGKKDFKYSSQTKSDELSNEPKPAPQVISPTKNISSPVKRIDSTCRTASPKRQESHPTPTPVNNLGSPVKRVESTKGSNSPLKRVDSMNRSPARKHSPVKITSSFRSRGSPSTSNSPNKGASSPGGGLRTMPSIRVKPNSVVSRALAKLQSNCSEDESDSEDESCLPKPVETVAKPQEVVHEKVTESPQNKSEIKPKEATPGRSNTTVDDSMFINNNMAQIQHDLDAMKSDIIKEESEHEESQNTEDSGSSFEDLCDEVLPDTPADPITKMNIEPEREAEESMETDDSLEDLVNDVMPSPSKEEGDMTEDSEWLDFSPDVRDKQNTSLKRDADCLAESVLGSVESFISCDLTTTSTAKQVPRNERTKALSPVQPLKKMRRSMSVSDIPNAKSSPARFVRLDNLRSSSSSLRSRNVNFGSQSSKDSSSSTSRGSGYYSYNSSQEDVTPVKKGKSNSYKGPLEEGTLEIRPPFEQVKVLEQGIMVQKELETQAAQLLEHCQYGLEQVEAEKLLLVAGLKKNLWNYHLAEVKDEKHIFSSEEVPKGYLEIKGISMLLRQDYLVNKVVETKKNQAFFVVVKVSPYRILTTNIATSECNIHGTNLSISDTIVIDNLPPDYKITLEVYCMSYNMMNNATPARKTSKVSNTPKKLFQNAINKIGAQKKTANPLASSMESYSKSGSTTPRGGSTSSRGGAKKSASQENKFALAGTLNLSIKDAKKDQFRLRRAPFHSPFEGTINLSMTAKEAISSQPPSHKGFLTIFQDESGLGAWNRRWCSVQDNKIYYWLYPEDEVNQNKQPHGEIDLRNCKTETVSVASRLDCARPNTFVLVIMAAAQPGDRTSIITESNGKTTQTKYLLSADSREERKQWMEVLNKCLQSVHSWNH